MQSRKKTNLDTSEFIERKHKKKMRLKAKLLMHIVLVFFSVLFCTVLFVCALEKENKQPIEYSERGSIDYKIYLKPNEFYTEEYLLKGKTYIANLIKHIDADISYLFKINRPTIVDFDYQIIGELIIENTKGTSRYFEKTYDITEKKQKRMNNVSETVIVENITLDYNKYNTLANKFRSAYGVDAKSYLKIYINMHKKTEKTLDFEINEQSKIDIVTIPLSERAIEININSPDSTVSKEIIPKEEINVNKKYLFFAVILLIFSLYAILKVIVIISIIIKKGNKYDRYIKKILRQYDRLVVEVNTTINFEDHNIIKVNKFSELLDVRDNLKIPISYYIIEEHEEGIFYIKYKDDIYLLRIKRSELEKTKKES